MENEDEKGYLHIALWRPFLVFPRFLFDLTLSNASNLTPGRWNYEWQDESENSHRCGTVPEPGNVIAAHLLLILFHLPQTRMTMSIFSSL